MSWFKKDKEKDRFYLLAGMGGEATRRKHKVFLAWSLLAGVVVSLALAFSFYILNVRW